MYKTLMIILLIFHTSSLFSQTFVYECQDNKNFILEIRKADAWLFTRNISTSLEHVKSGSGSKYKKGNIVFWSKGYESMLDVDATKYRNCKNNKYKAIWEDSKLRGNDFRATGNEPGWYLEIANGGKESLLVLDYGQDKYKLSFLKAYISQEDRTTIYSIKGFVDILIEAKSCKDSMSGKPFESTVTVKINNKTYHGCGKALH